jgi:bifunctional non-homologous end joining protein LigD
MWLQLVYRCLSSLSDGPTVFAHACKMGLEGIVSKRKDSTNRSGRSPIGSK